MRYCAVLIGMKVRFVKSVLVEIEKTKLNEVWDKQFSRWDELLVEKMDLQGRFAFLTTFDGDVYLHVPKEAFEILN